MNNKRGGVGGKILLVLILMLLAAIGGAYGFRVLDGKLAVNEAQKYIDDIDVADYDTAEGGEMQAYINNAKKDLGTAKTRKQVYEILDDFKEDAAKVPTKQEKELEEAKRAAEQAKNSNNNNNNNNNNNGNNNNNYSNDSNTNNNSGSGTDANNNSSNDSSGGYKSNNLSGGEEQQEDSGGGLLDSIFGWMDNVFSK